MKHPRIGWWIGPTRFRAVSPVPVTIKAWLVFGVGRRGTVRNSRTNLHECREGEHAPQSTKPPDDRPLWGTVAGRIVVTAR